MLRKARQNIFPKKNFINNGKIFGYTSYLNFTQSENQSSQGEKILFNCIFCKEKFYACLGRTSNIKVHLERHFYVPDLITWFQLYGEENCAQNRLKIDDFTIKLVKFFIGSNSSLNQFDSIYFKDLFSSQKIDIPCSKTFCEKTLPAVYESVNNEIEKKLKRAASICLVSDIWTNKPILDFLGLAANIVYDNFEKEILVIGMVRMSGRHNAENIKQAIESIVVMGVFLSF
ncbi:unnamed protein product [Brachionus calyciflorus]|uniref:BED-type domain-containing protein n=1 Tax=Brachionus calyciflorus TaxID=104777 RepID=A0A814RUB9_9BILA|nr:unnamed protein product [Brachionus calyciflorus]